MYNQTLPHGEEALAETWEYHRNVAWTQVNWHSKNGTQPSFPVHTKGNALRASLHRILAWSIICGRMAQIFSSSLRDLATRLLMVERHFRCSGKWSSWNRTNRTGGYGPDKVSTTWIYIYLFWWGHLNSLDWNGLDFCWTGQNFSKMSIL